MKHQYLSLFLVFTLLEISGQSTFNPVEFQNYRQQIKNMTTADLLQMYPPNQLYYSERDVPSVPGEFQYLDSIDNVFQLRSYEKELLADNHFMVSERLGYSGFADAFVHIYNADLPLFLSTDFVLHAFHTSYDEMLKDLEIGVLEPNLLSLLESLRSRLREKKNSMQKSSSTLVSVKDVDLYLSVAISLLKDERVIPEFDDSENYAKLLDAIYDESVTLLSIGLFSDHNRTLDVSQFTPRGHYTEEFWMDGTLRDLKAYFRAMMWLGRIDFWMTPPPVAPGEAEWSEKDIKRMAGDALLLNELLQTSERRQYFDLHEKIISFFVGPDDNLSPGELQTITEKQNLSISDLEDEQKWLGFQAELRGSNDYGQKIMSNFFIVDADTQNPADLPVSYRFFGQKFLIDSWIFHEVVYDRVYFQDKEVMRMMPDPLDIMFVLGNNNSLSLLETELNTYPYAHKLEELRALTSYYEADFWTSSLYNIWLDAIRELNTPDEGELPFFMKTTEWQLEKLNTQLASWAELRHDNVLYAKQSYTGGTSCSFPFVFIEPYPGLYEKLALFASEASGFFNDELTGFDFDGKEQIIDFYRNFERHMNRWSALSKKEISGERFNDEDIVYLKTFVNSTMMSGPSITGWFNEMFYKPWKGAQSDYLVVDVHTQPTDERGAVVGNILHVGTGDINLGVFCAGNPANNNNPTAFIGPVMSFHQKIEQGFKRLNDEEWEKFFRWGQEQPERPDWVNHYLADPEGKKQGSGDERNIPGVRFISGMNNNDSFKGNVAYSFVFPNPAKESAQLGFVLNQPAIVYGEIFTLTGSIAAFLEKVSYTAGEHRVKLPTEQLREGVYFLKLTAGKDTRVIRFIKQ